MEDYLSDSAYGDPWITPPELIGNDYNRHAQQIWLWFAEKSIDHWFPISTLVVVGPYAFDITTQQITTREKVPDPSIHGFVKFSELAFEYKRISETEPLSSFDKVMALHEWSVLTKRLFEL